MEPAVGGGLEVSVSRAVDEPPVDDLGYLIVHKIFVEGPGADQVFFEGSVVHSFFGQPGLGDEAAQPGGVAPVRRGDNLAAGVLGIGFDEGHEANRLQKFPVNGFGTHEFPVVVIHGHGPTVGQIAVQDGLHLDVNPGGGVS